MNILFVHEIDWVKRVVFELHMMSELLSLRGHNVYAIDYGAMLNDNSLWSQHREINMARAYKESKVTLIRAGFINAPIAGRISASVSHYFTIKEVIKKHKIDVIILYSVPTNGLQTLYLAKNMGIPVVFRSIDVLNQLVPRSLAKATEILEGKVYSKVGLVIALNDGLARYVTKLGAKRVKILPLGVDCNIFRPDLKADGLKAQWKLKELDKIVVFIGTLYKFSGLDNVIKMFPRILKEVPEAKLLIVGDGEQRKELEMLVETLKLQKSVIITGFLPYEMMPQYINLARVCINPSISCAATESIFPTKVIQYLACGKPVIATKLSGLFDVIGIGNGVLFDDIQKNLVMLLKNSGITEFMGQKALDYVKDNHSYDKIMTQLEEILIEEIGEYCTN